MYALVFYSPHQSVGLVIVILTELLQQTCINLTLLFCSIFKGNNASGIAAATSLLRMSGVLLFEGNSARAGACLYAVQGTKVCSVCLVCFCLALSHTDGQL